MSAEAGSGQHGLSGPAPGAEEELSLDLPCDQEAPAAVRDVLKDLSGDGSTVGDAMLVASELVTNAVKHSGGRPGDTLTVDLTVGRGRLLIAVVDPGRSSTRAQAQSEGGVLGGFGLRLVEALADRWGSERAERHRVWAELALHG
jgi:anti-sigma regulatory factor (Ser/Thr protein kinase)